MFCPVYNLETVHYFYLSFFFRKLYPFVHTCLYNRIFLFAECASEKGCRMYWLKYCAINNKNSEKRHTFGMCHIVPHFQKQSSQQYLNTRPTSLQNISHCQSCGVKNTSTVYQYRKTRRLKKGATGFIYSRLSLKLMQINRV